MFDLNTNSIQVLTVPPWENAGEDHWMTAWENKYPNWRRVEQKDWMNPVLEDWVDTLDEFVQKQTKPVFLVAHSLGCLTVLHWAKRFQPKIAGAFLTAPPDVEKPGTPAEILGFAPVPLHKISFPGILIASENDPYAAIERSRCFAGKWNFEFANIGNAGHINPRSGFGDWKEGEELLKDFINRIARKTRLQSAGGEF